MTNQVQGRKKSQFLAQSTISDADFFDFVTGNTNKKVSFADFKTQLGVTGTLQQQGDVLGVPILDQAGSVNNIRNLEAGSGVTVSVSAQNGAKVAHNFTQDTVGAPVLVDPTAVSPIIASLEGVGGITITSVSEPTPHIEIGLSATPVSTKTVVVNELSDFPAPVSGVITLEDDKEYLLTNDINLTTNRIVMGDNTAVKGTESILITLDYTGTGDMFTMVDQTNRISNMRINCANGRIINWSCTALKIFRMNDVSIVSCTKFGLFSGVSGILRFTNVSPAAITTDGLEFTGDFRSFLYEVSASTISGGALFNLGTATFDSFIANTILATLGAGTNLVSGAALSANINTGGIGLIDTMRVSGTGTQLSGISVDDALWEFRQNDDIADTRPDGLLSMQGNATNTVIAVAGTPVLVAGTWVEESTSQMTGTAAGRLTYDGGKAAKLPITASVTLAPVSGGSITVSACIAVDGAIVPGSVRTATASAGSSTSITVPWQENMPTGRFIEVFVANEDTTVDLLVSSAIFRIN